MGYTKTAVKGFSWLSSLKVAKRGVGYARIAVLARILTPEQFGVFGVATLVLAFLEIFTETGINVFLVQERTDIDKYIDTAWVISIIRGVLISVIIFLASGLISSFFDSPRAYGLLVAISFVPLMRGFINPSIVKLKKELMYPKQFMNEFLIYLVESAVIVAVALSIKNEFAFAVGLIAGVVVEIIFSFILVKPVPKLTFEMKKAKQIVHRGYWVTIAGIFNYLNGQGDDAVVGKLIGVGPLGIYQNVYKISTLPLTEVSQVVSSLTFSIYVKLGDDRKRLMRAFKRVLLVVILAVVPIGVIFYAFPEIIIKIILGDAWLVGVDALRALSVFGVLSAILVVPNPVFLALKKQNIIARLRILQFIVLAFSIIPMVLANGIVGAAYSVTLSVIVALPVSYFYLYRLGKA